MEFQQPSRRLFILNLIIGMLVGILVVRLWQVQVLQGASYLRQSEENRIRDYTLTAPRGIIYDRKGRPLVRNRPAFTVAVLPLELRNPLQVIQRLASILTMPPEEITARIDRNRPRLFEPVRIKRDAGPHAVAMIEENRLDLPGVIILPEPVRDYVHGKMAAHVLGYLGEIDPTELAARQVEGYKPGDLIGKAGVERAYETVLRGTDGRLRMEVDALGRPLRVLSRAPAIPGRAIVLTLDLDVQKAAYDALQASGMQAGAAIAMDPRTGDILAMASIPSYDPNLFAISISPQVWQAITTDRSKPLLNRAIAATYEPGSVFKLVTATAALDHGIVSRRTMFDAPGYFQLGQWTFGDLRAWGRIDFLTGLGELTGVDLPGEINGTIPSPSTKEQLVGEPWFPGDSVNMSIGQGAVTVTPIQVARMLGGIATGGPLLQPRVVLMTYDRTRSAHPSEPYVQRSVPYQDSTLALLREGMRAVVERGSGYGARVEGLPMAGKTGSAENPRGKPHAWFAGYAPVADPRIVVVAFVEHGFRGGISAAPVARAMLRAVFPRPADVQVPR